MSYRILIDGDLILHKAAHVSQTLKYGVWSTVKEFEQGFAPVVEYKRKGDAVNWVKGTGSALCIIQPLVQAKSFSVATNAGSNMVNSIRETFKENGYDESSEPIMYFTDSDGNFRKQLSSLIPYKGNRKNYVRPYWFNAIKEMLKDRYNCVQAVEEEADDCLGRDGTNGQDCVIASLDKDMLTIPGKHLNWVRRTITNISEREAMFNFYSQLLQGDVADNVVGIKGMGPVRANKHLERQVSLQIETEGKSSYEDSTQMYESQLHSACSTKYLDFVIHGVTNAAKTDVALSLHDMDVYVSCAKKWLNSNANLLWIRRTGREQWGRDQITLQSYQKTNPSTRTKSS